MGAQPKLHEYKNPISFSFRLISDYSREVDRALLAGGLSEEWIDEVRQSMDVDQGVFLSKAPSYQPATHSLRSLCFEERFAKDLADRFVKIEVPYEHQERAILSIHQGQPTVISTGTGSGKTESFLVPIINHCLVEQDPGIKAVLLYPMNALASDQLSRVKDATQGSTITYGIYTGDTPKEAQKDRDQPNLLVSRSQMHHTPPDILITNPVMLDRLLTGLETRSMFGKKYSGSLRYVVLDEMHTYRGSKAVHIRCLLQRLRKATSSTFVPVGSSATLQQAGGYLGDEQTKLTEFIKGIFALSEEEDFTFVEPQYKERKAPIRPLPLISSSFQYGWNTSLDTRLAMNQIKAILGAEVIEAKFKSDPRKSNAYAALRDNAYVRALEDILKQRCMRFAEAVALFERLYQEAHGEVPDNSENVVKTYLSCISYFNDRCGATPARPPKPIIDLRLHVFLRDVSGRLKRCIECGRFHSGKQSTCQDCNGLLFLVDRNDASWCIAKLTQLPDLAEGGLPTGSVVNGLAKPLVQVIRADLRQESNDPQCISYIRIRRNQWANYGQDGLAKTINCLELLPAGDEQGSLRIMAKRDGSFEAELLVSLDNAEKAYTRTIPLIDSRHDYHYLERIIDSLLEVQEQSRSLLSFVDNRERVAQFAHVIQENFLDRYFLETLSVILNGAGPVPLPVALKRLRQHIPLGNNESFEEGIAKDVPLWFARFISERPNYNGAEDFLVIDEVGVLPQLSDTEQDAIKVFLRERAIRRTFIGDLPDAFLALRFGSYVANQEVGFYDTSSPAKDDDRSSYRKIRSVALSENAIANHAEVIKRHGLSRFIEAIQSLVKRGIIQEWRTPDAKRHYSLKAESIQVIPERLPKDPLLAGLSEKQLRDRFAIRFEAHSSEVKPEKRVEIEQEFKDKKIPVLFCTPTLEMGVDIGGLETVLMVGVPRLPSNYAQRSGRAGRGNKQEALLVTFCEGDKNHDAYYFEAPEKMINGAISPPAIDVTNTSILQKHINAYVLSRFADSGGDVVEAFARSARTSSHALAEEVNSIFTPSFDVEGYLGHELPQSLRAWQDASSSNAISLNVLYKSGFFPDYEFRREEVKLVLSDDLTADTDNGIQQSGKVPIRGRSSIEISSYPPELAYTKFVPHRLIFHPRDRYRCLASADPKSYEKNVIASEPVRSYMQLQAIRQADFGGKDRHLPAYDKDVVIEALKPSNVKREGPIRVGLIEGASLGFVNRGLNGFSEFFQFEDEKGTSFKLGYKLTRDIILLQIDQRALSNPSDLVSLASAMDRTIKDEFGLDENEIQLVFNPKICFETDDRPFVKTRSVLFYDVSGSGSVPMQRIYDHFWTLAGTASAKMMHCEKTRKCRKGCYQCLRSHTTQIYAHLLSKQRAVMLTRFLSGEANCDPSIEPLPEPKQTNLTVSLTNEHGNWILMASQPEERLTRSGTSNEVLYKLLEEWISNIEEPHTKRLLIRVDKPYVINAFLGTGKVNNGREAFRKATFSLLGFKSYRVECIS